MWFVISHYFGLLFLVCALISCCITLLVLVDCLLHVYVGFVCLILLVSLLLWVWGYLLGGGCYL